MKAVRYMFNVDEFDKPAKVVINKEGMQVRVNVSGFGIQDLEVEVKELLMSVKAKKTTTIFGERSVNKIINLPDYRFNEKKVSANVIQGELVVLFPPGKTLSVCETCLVPEFWLSVNSSGYQSRYRSTIFCH